MKAPLPALLALLSLVVAAEAAAATTGAADSSRTLATASPGGGARGSSWISLGAMVHTTPYGTAEVSAMLTVGVAFDRIAAGPIHRTRETPLVLTPEVVTKKEEVALLTKRPVTPKVSPGAARACVRAALRASGLGTDDARIDAIVARSRASASLPELRLRAMRVLSDDSKTDTATTTSDSLYYQTIGGGLTLEARATWRLDRLLYADDETAMERVRMERVEARQRLATRVLEALFQWQRAIVQAEETVKGSSEENDARLREAEAVALLDVLTGGWFSPFANDARAHSPAPPDAPAEAQ